MPHVCKTCQFNFRCDGGIFIQTTQWHRSSEWWRNSEWCSNRKNTGQFTGLLERLGPYLNFKYNWACFLFVLNGYISAATVPSGMQHAPPPQKYRNTHSFHKKKKFNGWYVIHPRSNHGLRILINGYQLVSHQLKNALEDKNYRVHFTLICTLEAGKPMSW